MNIEVPVTDNEVTGKTETIVRTFDNNGDLQSETVTTVTQFEPTRRDDYPIGMYL